MKSLILLLAAAAEAYAQDTTPPVITCPANVTLTADDSCAASYDGPAATATDDQDPDPAIGPMLPVALDGPGDHVLTHTATDAAGNTASCDQTVTVVDATPPVLVSVETTPACLWPPNHRLVAFRLGENLVVETSDACDSEPGVEFDNLTSDEPENGRGDGNTAPDVLVGDQGFCLRSERAGNGDGRQYLVQVRAVDAAGNASEEMIEIGVGVAHDQSGHDCPALDDADFVDDGDPACAMLDPDPDALEEPQEARASGCSAAPGGNPGIAAIALLVLLAGLSIRRR